MLFFGACADIGFSELGMLGSGASTGMSPDGLRLLTPPTPSGPGGVGGLSETERRMLEPDAEELRVWFSLPTSMNGTTLACLDTCWEPTGVGLDLRRFEIVDCDENKISSKLRLPAAHKLTFLLSSRSSTPPYDGMINVLLTIVSRADFLGGE